MIEIGTYKIEWVDEHFILVTKKYGDNIIHTAKIAGGEMETFLNGIFLAAEMTYKFGNMTIISTHKTTYKNDE